MRLLLLSLVLLLADLAATAQQKDTLTLEEVINVALNNNYAIQVAKMESQIAANNLTRGNAGFLPIVNINAAKNFNSNNVEGLLQNGNELNFVWAKSDNYNLGAAMSWTIFDGFRMFTTYERLEVLKRQGEVNARAQIENTMAQVVVAYYTLLVEQERLAVLKGNLETSDERMKIAKSKYEVGSGSKLEYLSSQVDYNADRTGLIRQEELVNISRTVLNQLILFNLDEKYSVSPTIRIDETLDLDNLIGSFRSANNALIAARQNIYIADLAVKELQAERLPTVSLNAGFTFSGNNNPAGFLIRSQTEGYNYGVSASWNVFNGMNLNRNIQNAKIMSDISTIRTQELEVNQEAELRVAYLRYINNLALLEMEKDNVTIAIETADIALERYKLGVSTPLELREAQRITTAALIRKLDVEYAAKLAELELYRLSGNLIGRYVEIN